MDPNQNSRPSEASLRMGRGVFSLLLSLVLGICLLGWMVWDPSERTALQKEMNRLHYVHDQKIALAYLEAQSLNETIVNLQQILRDTQQDLLMTQHALGEARKASNELAASGRTVAPSSHPQVEAPAAAPAAAQPAVAAAAPESPAERLARMGRDLAAIQQAVRQNAAEYLNVSETLAQTKRSLAFARGVAAADAVGQTKSAGVVLAEWPLEHFLNEADLAGREAAGLEKEAGNGPVPADPLAMNREMASLNRTLVWSLQRLGDSQKQLGALQEELRTVLAQAPR